jgi:hypothetical protein
MRIYVTLLASMMITVVNSCTTRKITFNDKGDFELPLYAWNQDTVRTWQFALTRRNTFSYCISSKAPDLVNCYSGKVDEAVNSDTIFLKYKRGIKPPHVVPYLIREVSGNYLVQPFGDNSQRIFLRISKRRY